LHTYHGNHDIALSCLIVDPTNPSDVATAEASSSADAQGLLQAMRSVLLPLARLGVARGLTYAQLDEMLKGVMVEAAREVHAHIPLNRAVSRISAATGINRREVTRLSQPATSGPAPRRASLTNELFARWLTSPDFRHEGQPRVLPRHGPHPSFESLAQSISQDVRPRAFLEELCRLGIARVDEAHETVELLRNTFVPDGDAPQMFGFLGHNVGDHLSAAVHNVLNTGVQHLEQALFADELSVHSIEYLRPLVGAQWRTLLADLAPVLQQLIDQDAQAGRPQDQRIRIGMYAYSTAMDTPSALTPGQDANPTQP
jgi:Family of unknown function (DUF6502)